MLLEATTDFANRITGAIKQAARATGANFEYLLKTAQRESNLDPAAKASTSSATGLFQFIDQTWLQTLKNAGPSLGYGRYADSIVQTGEGRYVVPDAGQRQEIMGLRKDPVAASAMAGAFTQKNATYLTERLGRPPTDGELYIAHFLGANGAASLIATASRNPKAPAAELFPTAARANRSIFYGKGGARSAADVYQVLVAKHQNTRTPAGVSGVTAIAAAAAPAAAERGVPLRSAPTAVAAVTALEPAANAYAGETGPVFHNLFRTGRDTPVSAVVSELWTAQGAQSPARASAPTAVQPAAATSGSRRPAGRPLQLFHFLRPEIRAQANRSA